MDVLFITQIIQQTSIENFYSACKANHQLAKSKIQSFQEFISNQYNFQNNRIMNYFPHQANNNLQVLWQPVPIQQFQNQTIEQLQRQNSILKSQLSAFLQRQRLQQNDDIFIRQGDGYNRCSFGSPQHFNLRKSQRQSVCYSPRAFTNHQRIQSNYLPRQQSMQSPTSTPQAHKYQQSMNTNEPAKRMVIEKGEDGKFYRNKVQENKLSQFLSTDNYNSESHFVKTNASTNQSSLKSQMKASQHYQHFSEIGNCIRQNEVKRVKSPNFLKQKCQQNNTPIFQATNLEDRAKMSKSQWNQSHIKISSPVNIQIQKSQQETPENDSSFQRNEQHYRRTTNLPTNDLSQESDSDVSIERAVKQLSRSENRPQKQKRDTLIFEMQEKLQNLYGGAK